MDAITGRASSMARMARMDRMAYGIRRWLLGAGDGAGAGALSVEPSKPGPSISRSRSESPTANLPSRDPQTQSDTATINQLYLQKRELLLYF